MRPRIGIGAGCSRNNERVWNAGQSYSYIRSVVLAGGLPILLPPAEDLSLIPGYLGAIDALLLTGGNDIPSETYGEPPLPMVDPLTGPRLQSDLALCRAAIERGTPVLAICLGCQILNVALGGTLYQDLLTQRADSQIPHRWKIFPYYLSHEVNVEPGTRLHSIVGASRILTNTAHHQAIREPGRGLRVTARADDGVIEAVELEDAGRFALGIQWHPEKLAEREDGPHRALFRALVEQAAVRRAG